MLCFCFRFLRHVYPILPVFLDCTFSSPCVPYIASFSALYFFFALCTLYCQFSWIVLFLRLVYPILPVFLDCTFSSPCVPYIASFPGLSIIDWPCVPYTTSFPGLSLIDWPCVPYIASFPGLSLIDYPFGILLSLLTMLVSLSVNILYLHFPTVLELRTTREARSIIAHLVS